MNSGGSESSKFFKIITIVLFISVVIFILTWAPWLDNETVKDKILSEYGKIDGSLDKSTGEIICDYNVMYAPLGRWVASCEGGYFVAFWGTIL